MCSGQRQSLDYVFFPSVFFRKESSLSVDVAPFTIPFPIALTYIIWIIRNIFIDFDLWSTGVKPKVAQGAKTNNITHTQ